MYSYTGYEIAEVFHEIYLNHLNDDVSLVEIEGSFIVCKTAIKEYPSKQRWISFLKEVRAYPSVHMTCTKETFKQY